MKFQAAFALIPISLFLGQACDGALGAPCAGQQDCPSSATCVRLLGKTESTCRPTCSAHGECGPSELCQNLGAGDPTFCGPAPPICHPEAQGDECECGMLRNAVRVQGQGDDCQVLQRDVSVCAWVRGNCLDGGCTEEYLRYSLGDDSGYLVRAGGTPTMSEGWEPDGSPGNIAGDPAPTSCPAAATEF